MTNPDACPKIALAADTKPAAVRGRPWVFANQLKMTAETRALPPGSVVRLMEPDGRLLGLYHFNPHSLIAARLLTRNHNRAIDARFFTEKLTRALALRDRLFDAPCYRLAHGEGDGLPGLIVDRYGDVLVVQPNTAGMDASLDLIVAALESLVKPAGIAVVADGPARAQEGLAPRAEVLAGTVASPVPLVENGITYLADPIGGQKTGWFYDHRLNRAFAAGLARGQSVLDLYTYAGAFALACARGGATSVTAVDRSAPALALATEAAARNGWTDRVTTETAEVFSWLENNNRTFGLVVADPPAFAKTRKDIPAALKGYEKLARLSTAKVAPEGFLCLASCSHHVTPEAFLDACAAGIRAGGRSSRLIHQAGAGPDHPVHPQLPQTAYLKFLAFALD